MERRLVGEDYPWTKALWWQLMEWYVWGMIAPGVFWFCRKAYSGGQNWTVYVLRHLLAGVLCAILQAFVCTIGGLVEMWLRGWPLTTVGEPYSFAIALKF